MQTLIIASLGRGKPEGSPPPPHLSCLCNIELGWLKAAWWRWGACRPVFVRLGHEGLLGSPASGALNERFWFLTVLLQDIVPSLMAPFLWFPLLFSHHSVYPRSATPPPPHPPTTRLCFVKCLLSGQDISPVHPGSHPSVCVCVCPCVPFFLVCVAMTGDATVGCKPARVPPAASGPPPTSSPAAVQSPPPKEENKKKKPEKKGRIQAAGLAV